MSALKGWCSFLALLVMVALVWGSEEVVEEEPMGFDYEDDDYDKELWHSMGRIHTLMDFDVTRRANVEIGSDDDFMMLFRRFDVHHAYPEDLNNWLTITPAEKDNKFMATVVKEIMEDKKSLREIMYGSLTTLVYELEAKEKKDIPELDENSKIAFEGMVASLETMDQLITEDLERMEPGFEGEVEEEIREKLASVLSLCAFGVHDIVGDDFGDEAGDWDAEGFEYEEGVVEDAFDT